MRPIAFVRRRPARCPAERQPDRGRDHVLAVGRVPRRGLAAARHPRDGVVLAAGRAEHDPARGEGDRASTSTRCSRSTRRCAADTTRRSCSPRPATSPTAPASTSSSSRDGVVLTPDLSASILPGITRDTVIALAGELGYEVVETQLVRSDLYTADEVFMCGTAAEVTPLRSVDDHELGVGPITLDDPGGLPRRCPRRAVARGPAGSTRCRRRPRRPPSYLHKCSRTA